MLGSFRQFSFVFLRSIPIVVVVCVCSFFSLLCCQCCTVLHHTVLLFTFSCLFVDVAKEWYAHTHPQYGSQNKRIIIDVSMCFSLAFVHSLAAFFQLSSYSFVWLFLTFSFELEGILYALKCLHSMKLFKINDWGKQMKYFLEAVVYHFISINKRSYTFEEILKETKWKHQAFTEVTVKTNKKKKQTCGTQKGKQQTKCQPYRIPTSEWFDCYFVVAAVVSLMVEHFKIDYLCEIRQWHYGNTI